MLCNILRYLKSFFNTLINLTYTNPSKQSACHNPKLNMS